MSKDAVEALSLNDITKRFGELTANDAVSLSVNVGEVVALLGENGAGKTTLMNILFGQYTADSGTVRVFMVVPVESVVVAEGLELIRPSVAIRVSEAGEFGLLHNDDAVAFVVLDLNSESFVGSFGKEGPLVVANAPDPGGAGGHNNGPVFGHGDADGLEELIATIEIFGSNPGYDGIPGGQLERFVSRL